MDGGRQCLIGVVGPGRGATDEDLLHAEEVGRLLAAAGHRIVNGGLDGVMAASARGARSADGLVIGLLPGDDPSEGNQHLSVALPTGLGELRNALIVRSADAMICVGGSWGTLSEVALAVRTGVPIVAIGGWELPEAGVASATTPREAVGWALRSVGERLRG